MITTDTHVFFYGAADIYSNFHRTKDQFRDPLNNDIVFDSTEQAFMWWKAVFHQDLDIASLLEREKMPANAKSLGRQIKGYNDKAWECVRLGFMTYVCYMKFSQNPEFAAALKATGRRTLVEASPYDAIWGVGLSEDDAWRYVETGSDTNGWPGRNLLGEALMTVRGLL